MSEEDYKKLIKQPVDTGYWEREQDATKWGQADVTPIKKPRKAKPSVPCENTVKSQCMQYLWTNGCFVWVNNTGAYKPEKSNRYIRYGKKGSPDIIGVTPSGKFIGVECKRQGEKAKDHQLEFGEKITANNGIYIVAHSMDELADALKGAL